MIRKTDGRINHAISTQERTFNNTCCSLFVKSIRRIFNNGINITTSNPEITDVLIKKNSVSLETLFPLTPNKIEASFDGINYPLIKLDKRTPLIFQWFNYKTSLVFKDDDIPIINTPSHPYLNNIINAANIDSDRIIGVFLGGRVTEGQRVSLAALELKYQNIKILYQDCLNFTVFDKSMKEIINHTISTMSEDDAVILRSLQNILEQYKNHTLLSLYNSQEGHAWFDLYRNLIVMKGCSAFAEANKSGCESLPKDGGCIYLDLDMVLTEKIGDIYLPDGVGLYIKRDSDYGNSSLENGIIAVNRDNHPALQKGLKIMHENALAHPYYDGICKGFRQHFNFSKKSNYEEFCSFIEFKCPQITMNTSALSVSSWA